MFKGFGSWLGLEAETCPKTAADQEELNVGQQEKVVEAQNEVNKQQPAEQDGEPEGNQENPENPEHGQGLGDFIFSFASSATKKISDSMVETAQTIKKTVEEGKIDGIIDKTFLGDFQKEQEKFVSEKKAKKSEAAVPPWVGYNEEETIQQQILALSADKRNFLRDPPAGVQFYFDMEHMYPLAAVMLEEDQLLNRMRFDLVPKHVKEEAFWRNYFYRVSLIKQSAQLTALAAQQQQKDGEDRAASASPEDVVLTDNVRTKTPPVSISDIHEPTREEEEMCATEDFASEFMYGFRSPSAPLDDEEFRRAVEQMVLDGQEQDAAAEARNAEWEKEHGSLDDMFDDEEKPADWEKELEKELQEYDVMPDAEDDPLDDDLEKMLQAYNNNS